MFLDEVTFTVTNNIKFYRDKKYISQQQLAYACDVSRQTINSIENGKTMPNIVLALRIALKLNVGVHSLFQLLDSDGCHYGG